MLLAFYDNRGFKQPDEILRCDRKYCGLVHDADRTYALKTQLLRKECLTGAVWVYSDHQVVAAVGGKVEKTHMSWMYDVEIAGHKNNASPRRTPGANVRQELLHPMP